MEKTLRERQQEYINYLTEKGVTPYGEISESAKNKAVALLKSLFALEENKDEQLSIVAVMVAVVTK